MTLTLIWIAAGWLSGWLILKQMAGLDMPLKARRSNEDGASQSIVSQQSKNPKISVIIPARNEESNISKLLDSLAEQTCPAFEVIVADDGSNDRTAQIAIKAGARVIAPGPLPQGWFGKSWACWNGAKSVKGELLVFLDADTVLHIDGLRQLVLAYEEGNGLVTVQPYHHTVESFEKLSALCNLVVLASIHATDGRAGAFGPCAVCSRDTYFEVGGHQAVSSKVLENHAFGHVFHSLGKPVHNYTGKGIVSFRMYPQGLRSLIAGWCKSFTSGAAATPLPRLIPIVLWVAGAVSAVLLWSEASAITAMAIYIAYAVQLHYLLGRVGTFGVITALLFPLPLLMFLYIFIWSGFQTFLGGKVQWKGRSLSTKKERRRL